MYETRLRRLENADPIPDPPADAPVSDDDRAGILIGFYTRMGTLPAPTAGESLSRIRAVMVEGDPHGGAKQFDRLRPYFERRLTDLPTANDDEAAVPLGHCSPLF